MRILESLWVGGGWHSDGYPPSGSPSHSGMPSHTQSQKQREEIGCDYCLRMSLLRVHLPTAESKENITPNSSSVAIFAGNHLLCMEDAFSPSWQGWRRVCSVRERPCWQAAKEVEFFGVVNQVTALAQAGAGVPARERAVVLVSSMGTSQGLQQMSEADSAFVLRKGNKFFWKDHPNSF